MALHLCYEKIMGGRKRAHIRHTPERKMVSAPLPEIKPVIK